MEMSFEEFNKLLLSSKLRKCMVNDEEAYFHCWYEYSEIVSPLMMVGGHGGGTLKTILGLVEFVDGRVSAVSPSMIRFIDKEEINA